MPHILNKFGVMHTIPDDMPLPAGARKATPAEIADWQKADAENKAKLLTQKQEARQRAAQMVVIQGGGEWPVAPEPPETEDKPARGKAAKSDQPAP